MNHTYFKKVHIFVTWLPGRTWLFQRALDLLGLATIHHFIHYKTVSPSCLIT